MQQDLARAAAGFSLGLASCVLVDGHVLVGLAALPAVIFALHVLDPRKPLLLPIAVAFGRLCFMLPLLPLVATAGGLESLIAAWVVGPAVLYWVLLLLLYLLAAFLGCGCGKIGLHPRRRWQPAA